MNHIVRGSLGAIFIHLVSLAAAFGLTRLWTDGYEDASEQVKRLTDGTAASEVDVLFDLGDAQTALVNWLVPIFLIGMFCALLFLIRSASAKAAHSGERSALKPMWTVLLLLNIVLAAVLWWINVASPEAAFAMVAGNYTALLFLTFLLLLLSYYLSTALLVKPLLAPSVPFAPLIRGV